MANPFRTQSKNPFRQGEITAQPATQESMDAWRDKVMGTAGMDAIGRALVTKAQSAFGNAGGDTARAVYQAPATFARGVGGGFVAANAGINQMLRDYTPLGAVPGLGDWLQGASNQGAKDAANLQAAATANYQTDIGRDVGGAINSLGATAPLTAGAIIAKNPAIMYGGMGAQSGLTEYGNARQAGLKPLEALPYAATQAEIEMLTEMMPAGALVDAFKTKNPVANLIKSPLKYGAGEMAGEQLATLGQDFAQGAYIDSRTNPNWVQDYKDGRLDAARSTAVASLVMGPGNVGIAATAQAAKAAAQGVRRIEGKNPFRQAAANPQPDQQRLAAAINMPTNPNATQNAIDAVRAAMVNGGMKTRADIPQVHGNQAVANFVNKTIGVESGGNPNAKNRKSSATGLGQFIESTWLDMMRRHRPDLVQGKGRAEILALRANPAISREMTTRYTEENASALRKAGLPVTEGNLYLAHFSGAGTAAKALKANPNAPASSVYGQAAIDANGSILRGKTVGQVVAWANQKMGGKAQTTLPANQSMLSDGLNDGLMSDNLQPQYAPEDNGAQAEALNEIQRATREQRQAVEEMQDAARKAGKQTKVYLGEQMRNARLQMLEADDLQPTVADAANQYRDRNRAASQVQVNRIAQNLQPELLGDSMQADTGAPTLAKDGKTIIGGNGRVMGIAQAYAQGSGQSYKQYLIDNAEQFGLNPAEVAAMDKPVLIRRLDDDDVDIAKAAVASNEGGGLGMSALEQARVDADRLPDFGTFLPGDNGELNTPANRGFIRKFVGQMPTTVQAQMVDAQGMLSQDGIRRLHNAMLHRAYGNSPALSRMVESTDQGARNMVSAMMQAAPTIAKARDHIKSGAMHDADIAADIVSAVEKLNQLRENGGSTADYLAQQGMFEDDLSPVARDLLQFLDEHKRSAKAIATLLRNYYDLLGAQGSPNQADVFGDNTAPDKQQLLRKAADDYKQQNGTAEQNELFGNSETFRRPQDPDRQTGQQPESRRGDEAGADEDTGGAEKQQDGLKFSHGDNHHNSKSAYEAAKAARKTELTFHQWQQVRTPEFKAWFGDWENDPDNASKVVNEKTGEPMVVYHGTGSDFTQFNRMAWGSADPRLAGEYAEMRGEWYGGQANVMPVYMSIRRPFDADTLDTHSSFEYPDGLSVTRFIDQIIEQSGVNESEQRELRALEKSIRAAAREEESGPSYLPEHFWYRPVMYFGEDGARQIRRVFEIAGFDGIRLIEQGAVTYGAFRPEQIKSATGNSGAFDAGNNDIRFSRGATLGDKKKSDPADFNEALQQAGGFAAYDKAIAAGKTKLTLREWVWVRTPQFKRWFGDWENDPANASKIIDRETGEPKPVYHNSGEQLTEFDLEFVRTSAEIQAHFFAPESDPYKEYGEYEHIVFLNIRNPADAQTAYAGFGEKRVKMDAGIRQREELISKGYDGVVVEEDGEVVEYMAFHANQIKSATTQNGDFSPDNNDIRYSRAKDTKRASPEQIKQTRQAIEQAVGKQNMRHIEIVAREEVARPDNAEDLRDAQGWYDPKTQRITLIAEALPNQRTAQFVAWHELGHRKIDVDGWEKWQALFRTAYNGNPIIKQVADNIFKARKGAADGAALNKFLAVEEAVADLYAAHKTSDYAAFEQRNGVKVPQAMRNTLGGYFARMAEHLRTVLAKVMGVERKAISDAEIYGWLKKLDKAGDKVSDGLGGDAKFSRAGDLLSQAKQKVADLVRRVRADKGLREQVDLMPVSETAVVEAAEHGLDIVGYTHMLDSSAVNHVLNNHGNAKSEAARGQIGVKDSDFTAIINALENPDKVIYGSQNNAGREQIAYISRLDDGSLLVLQEQRVGKRKLALMSMRKYPATVDDSSVIRTLLPNARSDGGNKLSIVDKPKPRNTENDTKFSRGKDLSPQEKRLFNEIGELEVGVKTYNKLAGLLKPAFAKIRMANTAPEQFTQVMRDYRAQLNVAGRTAKTVANAGVKMTEAERKLLSDVLEKELPHGVEVSPELQELAAAMREILTQQSDDLVALDMLSEASRERFKDTYLPRLYAKHMTGDTALDALNKELGKAMRGALGNAVKGQHLKGRGLFKEVKRGEQAKYEAEGWEMRHDYGNKGKKAGVVVMWRDYTREERASMGEERDAMMRFTSGYIKTHGDIAKGMLFKRIAEDGEMTSDTAVEGWTHVPDTEIAGTGGVKRYGALAGKWVHPEVAYHLQQQFYIDNAVQKVWRAILGWWKLGKTVYNAVAHVNNFISNIVMTFSAGGKLRDIVPMALEIKRKGALYNEALEHGLIGEAVDVAGLQEMFVGLNNVSEDKLLDGLIMRTLKRADKLALNLPSKAAKAAQKAYRVEDEVFKLVLYKRGKEAGLSPQEAADYALTFMFDYSEVPQGVKWLRDTGILPFVSYTYKAMPAMARLALTRPHRVLMVTGFLYGINALSYALLGGAADEDEEREYMPDYQKGYTVFGTPKLIRLPWNDSKGKPIFIDVYRWLPLGDFADTQNQMGGLPLPQWATPNGPVISHAFALIGNKDTFTGRDIVKPYQSGGEKAATYGKWLAAQWLPASVGVPFSYHTNNVLEGAKSQFEGTKMADALEWMGYTGTTYRGEDKQLYRSLPGAFGVKLRGEKPADMKAAKQRQIGYEVREVKADMSRIRRDNTLTDAAKQARLEKRREALERLYEKRPD